MENWNKHTHNSAQLSFLHAHASYLAMKGKMQSEEKHRQIVEMLMLFEAIEFRAAIVLFNEWGLYTHESNKTGSKNNIHKSWSDIDGNPISDGKEFAVVFEVNEQVCHTTYERGYWDCLQVPELPTLIFEINEDTNDMMRYEDTIELLIPNFPDAV